MVLFRILCWGIWAQNALFSSSLPHIGVHKLIAKSQRWKETALAAATALICLWGSNAAALSLGRITVQSALGEPLRAEIDIPDINAEEAASLKASVALPDAFRASGLEYNPAMAGLKATLERRPDGRAYIRLSGDRVINDPYVDMVIEARWASGRVVRDYTMLFDPPSLRQAAPLAATPAQIPSRPLVSRPTTTTAPASPVAPSARPVAPRETTARPAAAATGNGAAQVTINRGDTAGKIAAAVKPATVSLDQMLVAMLRANPDAFIGDNINRVKAGAIMNVPTAEQASAMPAGEAARIIVAQSKDFNDFRRKLASDAPAAQVAASDRQASGSVQTQVDDKKPLTTAPDKLTLTKGAVQGKPAEDQLAKERSAQVAASRAAEIAKNITELSKLGAASASAVPPIPAASNPPPAKPEPTVVAAVTPPVQPVSTPVAPSVTAVDPKPAASAVVKAPATLPVAQPEPGLVDGLIENPLLPAGVIGLLALLVGLGLYRARQRKNASQVDSVFLESHLRPDSFFGASGGQSVDTNDSAATGSSMVYSPSQLDAVDDVDPVAEADVYLAYGRDMQAEEILKDALRTNPGRIAIHRKLLEIFAKRRDTRSFEETATQAFKISNGDAAEWERICELGLSIDPTNPLYQPGGTPNARDATSSRSAPLDFTSPLTVGALPVGAGTHVAHDGGSSDLDLDLDFSLDDTPASAISETTASHAQPDGGIPASSPASNPALDLDFGLTTEALAPVKAAQVAAPTHAVEFSLPDLDITHGDLTMPPLDNEEFKLQAATSFGATGPASLTSNNGETVDRRAPDLSMLEFDMESLSLDLGDAPEPDTVAAAEVHEDPLSTKLALAEEFRAIGDDDGARALIEEVISEASGDMKIKAQRALSHL